MKPSLIALLVSILLLPSLAHAKKIVLRMPAYSDGAHLYFYDLLYSAFRQTEHDITIEQVSNYPHLREREMLMTGDLDALWLIHTKERNTKYLQIPVGLTNGMIGKRVLLVSPNQKEKYKNVTNVDEFRELGKIGAFGKGWFDTKVWKANSLPYIDMADWRLIYDMVAECSRGIDYFSRGINEIVLEAKLHPELSIEPYLMLVYERDYNIYVSPKHPELVPILTDVLTKARDSGLIKQLIKKHWADSFEILKLGTRTTINLHTP